MDHINNEKKEDVINSWNDLLKNIHNDPNYNWDEGRPINNDEYKLLKEQLQKINVSDLADVIKKQLE